LLFRLALSIKDKEQRLVASESEKYVWVGWHVYPQSIVSVSICIKVRWQWSTTGIWSTGESACKLVAREADSKGLYRSYTYSWVVQLVPIVYCPYKTWISINVSISTFCAKAFVIVQFMRCHNVCTLKVTKTCGSNSAFVWYWLKISGWWYGWHEPLNHLEHECQSELLPSLL
jgi:hypothetical protein